LWAVPRTRADVVERALAQPTELQLATLERFADARLAAQDTQEHGDYASAPGVRPLHPVATITAANCPSRQHRQHSSRISESLRVARMPLAEA
jgi:hypothetical protein